MDNRKQATTLFDTVRQSNLFENQEDINVGNKSRIDELFLRVGFYRNGKEFKDLLYFCAKFKSLSPYNAMLVNIQRPNSDYVLNERQWRKRYDRKPKSGARPMIILVPFGPVDYVFDISDTEPINKQLGFSDNDILDQVSKPFAVDGKIDSNSYATFVYNLQYHGITLIATDTGSNFAGMLKYECNGFGEVSINLSKETSVKNIAHYEISVNSMFSETERFAVICHELAHFFCHHITAHDNWWNVRNIAKNEAEFEAETVSWLVCNRLGIDSKSERYLSHYLNKNVEIPNISLERIFGAVLEVEKMLKYMGYKNGLLWKKDKKFKKTVESLNKK